MKIYIVNYHEYYGLRIDTGKVERETEKLYIMKNRITILDYKKQIKKSEINNEELYYTFITDNKDKLLTMIEKIFNNVNNHLDKEISYLNHKKEALTQGKKDCEYYVNNILNKGDE